MHLPLLSKRGAKEKEKKKKEEEKGKRKKKKKKKKKEKEEGGKKKETCRAECLCWKTCLSVERQLFPRFVKSSRDRHTNGT